MGLEFRVSGLKVIGFRVQGLDLRSQDLGFRVQDSEFKV